MLILGDLTDAKDLHPAELINRVARELVKLRDHVPGLQHIYVLMGNHDYLREGHPTFDFLNFIPGLHFASKSLELTGDDGPNVLLLPHSKQPAQEWAHLDFSHYHMLMIHQTVKGARASNGQEMAGNALPLFGGVKVYSGDIHVPQVIADVEYVGSPYHVHFGDDFTPRCVLLDRRGRPHDLHHDNIRRISLRVRHLQELQLFEWAPGDQLKVRLELVPADRPLWRKLRQQVIEFTDKMEIQLAGLELAVQASGADLATVASPGARSLRLSDPDLIQRYVEREDLGGDALQIGLELSE